MSVELKVFGGAYFPKDKALKKHPDLKPLATAVNAATKAIAEAVIFGRLAAEHPEHIDDYFKVKIWEHREELPCPELDVFSPEFFDTKAIWNVNAGEPAAAPQPDTDESDGISEVKTLSVSGFSTCFQAAALALFGPITEVDAAQYNQIVDLSVDTESTPERENMEAIHHLPRILSLHPEKQVELLAYVAQKLKPTAKWPERSKVMEKWLDTPVDKRPQVNVPQNEDEEVIRTDSGARLRTGVPTDRNFKHSKDSLGNEIALGLLAREHEFNIYTVDMPLYQQAEKIRLSGTDEEFNAWYRMFISTPGGLDFSRAINIAVVKTAPEDLWKDPVKHREYFNRVMTESDHSKPDPLIVDIACGRSSSPMPQTIKENVTHDETKSTVPGETLPPAVCPGKAAQLDKELNDAFAQSPAPENQTGDQPRVENLGDGVFSVDALINTTASNEVEKQEVPPAPGEREISILHALNDLISGRTDIMGKEEAEGVVACTGQLVSDIIPLLMEDITATEFCLSPDFTDEEIHDVATTMLDSWTDDISVRQKIALDAIVEYRRPEPPKSVVLDPPSVTAKPKAEPEPAPEINAPLSSVTYLQQLTIAALQGLCSNPAYCNQYEELPAMAAGLARSVINHQEGSSASD
ncbi:exodeoxyribonuclease VIII [Enterobacter kobei]|uniref:exodeoxyribonuclease VIII n=1 Tax=Enterobacter kobei TaxID=208224 RepID=UPI00397B2DAC